MVAMPPSMYAIVFCSRLQKREAEIYPFLGKSRLRVFLRKMKTRRAMQSKYGEYGESHIRTFCQ